MKREDGVSSVELLIASAITIVILAGTMGAFNKSMSLSSQSNQLAELDQNLRAGINFLVRDFISAGWGISTGGIPIPSGTGASAVRRPGPPGTNYTFTTPVLSAVNPGAGMGPLWNGRPTDMVNIIYGDERLELDRYELTEVTSDAGGATITVDNRTSISATEQPVREGDLIVLKNANGSTLLYVTSVEGQMISFAANDPLRLNQPDAPQGSIEQLRPNDESPFPPTTATRVWMVTYYLDYTFDPTMPRLIRRINNRNGEPIALVLEDLQLTYDLVDGLTNPTNVDTPVSPNSPNEIRKANILVSGRSNSPLPDTGDYMRRTLTTQVSLRSLSFIDRYR